MLQLVVLSLDDHQYALPLSVVKKVFPIVEITQLPQVPEIIAGIVNVRGKVMPVFDIRKRLQLPTREIKITDQLILASTSKRNIGLIADQVIGLVECDEENIIDTNDVYPNVTYLSGVAKLKDGIALIHNLDKFLSTEEEMLLERAIRSPELDINLPVES